MSMTSAEFKCLRETMGLTTKWLANRWNVSEFSVQRWERNRELPDEFEQDMHTLHQQFTNEVATAAKAKADSCLIVPRTDMEAPRDMPAAWHRAVAQRAREHTSARILFYDDEQL